MILRRLPPTLLASVFLLFSAGSLAQSWSGILAPARAIDWSQAGANIINRTNACSTQPNLLTGTGNATANRTSINNAINASMGGNCVINLPSGTYYIAGTIQIQSTSGSGNFTIRGAGADQTFLNFASTNSNCNGIGPVAICVFNGDSSAYVGAPSNATNWTAGYSKGATSITLASVANLKVGSMLFLDQLDFTSDPGNIWACQTSGSNGSCSQQGASGVARSKRSQTQSVLVADCRSDHATSGACNQTTITISPGLYAPNWSASQSPQAWYSSTLPVTGVGIENLSLDYSALGDSQAGIEFTNVTNSWVRGIRSINSIATGGAIRKHILAWQSTHITARDSYFYGSSPTSEGYGFDSASVSGDNLFENNICQHLAACTITEGAAGSVFAYDYDVDNYYDNGAPNWQGADGAHHSAGDNYLLWEGYEGIGFIGDSIHGSSFMVTHFRSYLSGHDPATEVAPKLQATYAYFPFSYSRYYNLVGSVLGTQNYHTHYQNVPANASDCGDSSKSSLSVMVLGYSDQNGELFGGPGSGCQQGSFTIPNDLLVPSTLMRWGIYAACTGDSACNAVRWQSSEDASDAPTYPGLANPTQTLPPSFYLSAKPAWWGAMPWPAVGPDVAGGNVANVGGHVYHNPAANCYLNIMGGRTDGTSGALSFNANFCYASGPDAPDGVVAVPH